VARAADRAGFVPQRTQDLVLAVNELAGNSTRHGSGRGVLRVWREDEMLVCEVRDRGRIADPLAGRQRPDHESEGGWGLWIVNQVCDLVQVRSGSDGTVVRAHMRAA
jgi:anti-sigma regulatory factor (Ser/Thr protein kinase)